MRSPEQIVELYDNRSQRGANRQSVMNEIAAMYHGRVVVPLPELSKEERPAIANQVMVAIEQKAMRIADVFPVTRTHALKNTAGARRNATDRRNAFKMFHERNALPRKARTRSRHLAAYSSGPVLILPDIGGKRPMNIPKWMLIDPRGFYPSFDPSDPSNPLKDDAVMNVRRTVGWLRANHPDAAAIVAPDPRSDPDDFFDWLTYVDDEQITTLASRATSSDEYAEWADPSRHRYADGRFTALISHAENRVGEPLIVAPGGLSLTSEPMGRYDQVTGMYQRMAEIDALSRIALQKSIFSEAWAVSNPGEAVRVIQTPEPLEGIPGKVEGGRMEFRQLDPQFASRIGLSDLERNLRITGMIPAEFGGELPTNARTAKQGGRLMGSLVDFDVAEIQALLSEAMQFENDIAAKIDKVYFSGSKHFWFLDTGSKTIEVNYDPAVLWTTTKSSVSYALAGTDSEGTVIGAGQRNAMGTLSRESFMEADPMVKDVESEKDRITSEKLLDAFLSRVQQEAAAPNGQSAFSTTDLARLVELVQSDQLELIGAYSKVQEEAQVRQASQAPPGAPETLPGVSPGAEVPAGVQGPNPSQSNLTSLLGKLRLSQATVPGEIPAQAGAPLG